MDKFEKLVKQIMEEAEKDGEPVTRVEAEEMARMELGAKEISNYTQSATREKKKSGPKKVAVTDEKAKLFLEIFENLSRIYADSAQILKENKLISVKIGDFSFKIDVIQERNKGK